MKSITSESSINKEKSIRSREFITSKESNRKKIWSSFKDSQQYTKSTRLQGDETNEENNGVKEYDIDNRLLFSSTYSTASKVAKLQETGLLYAKKIEIETKKLKELDHEIQKLQDAIKIKRMELVDIEGNDADTYFKEIKKLEIQLEKVLGENHDVESKNRQIKEEINILRQERVVLNHIFHELEMELKTKENELDAVILQTDKVKQEKQKAQDQIDSLKRVVSQEQKKIQEEYKQYFDFLNEDKTSKFAVIEAHENSEPKIFLADESKILLNDEFKAKETSSSPPIRDTHYDGMSMMTRGTKFKDNHKSKYSYDLARVEKVKKEVEQYEKVFEMLRSRTGLKDINDIVQLFNKYEQENHSLFQFVNEITEEKESLTKKFLGLKNEMEFYANHEDPIKGDNPRAKKLLYLNKKIDEQNQKQQTLKKKYDELHKTIDAIKFGLPILLQKIGYQDNSDIKRILENDELNEMNMLLCLGYLETKADEILQIYEIPQSKDEAAQHRKFLDNVLKKSVLNINEDSYYTTASIAKNTTVNNGYQAEQNHALLKEFTTALDHHTKEFNTKEPEKRLDFDEYRGLVKKELQEFYKAKDVPPRESRKIMKKYMKSQNFVQKTSAKIT